MKQDSQTLSMWAAVLNRYEKSTVIPIVFVLTKTELNCGLSGSKPVLKKKNTAYLICAYTSVAITCSFCGVLLYYFLEWTG